MDASSFIDWIALEESGISWLSADRRQCFLSASTRSFLSARFQEAMSQQGFDTWYRRLSNRRCAVILLILARTTVVHFT